MKKWSNYYLTQLLGNNYVNVKLTPDGEFEGCEPISMWENEDSPFIGKYEHTSVHTIYYYSEVPSYVHQKLESPDKAVVRPANLRVKFSSFMGILNMLPPRVIRCVFSIMSSLKYRLDMQFVLLHRSLSRIYMLYDNRLNASFYLEYCSIKSDLPELLTDIEAPPFAKYVLYFSLAPSQSRKIY